MSKQFTAAQKQQYAKRMTYKDFQNMMNNVPQADKVKFAKTIQAYQSVRYHQYKKDDKVKTAEQNTIKRAGDLSPKAKQYFMDLSHKASFQKHAYNFSNYSGMFVLNSKLLQGVPQKERFPFTNALSAYSTQQYFLNKGKGKDPQGKKALNYYHIAANEFGKLSAASQKRLQGVVGNAKNLKAYAYSAKQYAFHHNPKYAHKSTGHKKAYHKNYHRKSSFVPKEDFFDDVTPADRVNYAHVIADFNDYKYNINKHNEAIKSGIDTKYGKRALAHKKSFLQSYQAMSAPSQTQLNQLNITQMNPKQFTNYSKQAHHFIKMHPTALSGITKSEQYNYGEALSALATTKYYQAGKQANSPKAKSSIAKNTKIFNQYFPKLSLPNQVKLQSLGNNPAQLAKDKFEIEPFLRNEYKAHHATATPNQSGQTTQTAQSKTIQPKFLEKVPQKNKFTFAQAVADADTASYFASKGNTQKSNKLSGYAQKAVKYLPQDMKAYYQKVISPTNKYASHDGYAAHQYVAHNKKAHFARVKQMAQNKQAAPQQNNQQNAPQKSTHKFNYLDKVPENERLDMARAVSNMETADYYDQKGNSAKVKSNTNWAHKYAKYLSPDMQKYYHNVINNTKYLKHNGYISKQYAQNHKNDFKQNQQQGTAPAEPKHTAHKAINDKSLIQNAQNPQTMATMLYTYSQMHVEEAQWKGHANAKQYDQLNGMNYSVKKLAKSLSPADQKAWKANVVSPAHNTSEWKQYQQNSANYLNNAGQQQQTKPTSQESQKPQTSSETPKPSASANPFKQSTTPSSQSTAPTSSATNSQAPKSSVNTSSASINGNSNPFKQSASSNSVKPSNSASASSQSASANQQSTKPSANSQTTDQKAKSKADVKKFAKKALGGIGGTSSFGSQQNNKAKQPKPKKIPKKHLKQSGQSQGQSKNVHHEDTPGQGFPF